MFVFFYLFVNFLEGVVWKILKSDNKDMKKILRIFLIDCVFLDISIM